MVPKAVTAELTKRVCLLRVDPSLGQLANEKLSFSTQL